MPQLVPFYFINQVVFGFTLLVVLIYAFSKFILPRFVRLSLSRIFIIKLNSLPKPHPFVNLPLQSGMPQLVPFYFINQVVFGFTLLVVLIYAFSKFILPRFVRLSLSRIFIIKLNSLPKPHPFVNLPLQSGMPQLVPFYFINQVVFGFTLLVVLIYAFSKFILPRFVRLSLSRIFIIKL